MLKTQRTKRIVRDFRALHDQPHRHWHYIYKQRKARRLTDDVNTSHIVIGQVFTVLASVAAGYVLELQKADLGLIIGAFVLMPGIIDLTTSLTGAMSAKINHHVNASTAHPSIVVFHSIFFSIFIGIFAGLIVGILGGIMNKALFNGDMIDSALLGVFSVVTILLISSPVIAFMTIGFKKIAVNPDNVIGPLESSIISIFTVITMAGYARILS